MTTIPATAHYLNSLLDQHPFTMTTDEWIIIQDSPYYYDHHHGDEPHEVLYNGCERSVVVETDDAISELSLGSDSDLDLSSSSQDDWIPRLVFSPTGRPKICTIVVTKAMVDDDGLDFGVGIANTIIDLMDEQVLDFCSALTEYDDDDDAWVFYIHTNDTPFIVVSAGHIYETLESLLSCRRRCHHRHT